VEDLSDGGNLADLYHGMIYVYVLEVSKMILADDEGKLHWIYTCVYMLYDVHTQHTYIYTHRNTHSRTPMYKHTHTHTHYNMMCNIYIYYKIIYHIIYVYGDTHTHTHTHTHYIYIYFRCKKRFLRTTTRASSTWRTGTKAQILTIFLFYQCFWRNFLALLVQKYKN
jgi:hypothetical protein